MATYLYCVRSDAPEVPPGLVGIDDASVRSMEAGSLVAWISSATETSIDATVDRVKAHDAVCAAALAVGETPLPIRFGQAFADDAAAAAAITARSASLESRLARIAGCVELRLVVSRGREDPPDANTPPRDGTEAASNDPNPDTLEGPGTAFLRRLARAGRADIARDVGCEEVRHAVRDAARALIVDQQPCESARGLSFFPVLVLRGAVDEFRAIARNILPSQAIDLSVLGPFAPYSFAGDA